MSELASVIARVRRRNGLTQRELAHRAGTGQATISRLESGREAITWDRFQHLMRAMGEEALITVRPMTHHEDDRHLQLARELTPGERIEGALNAAEFAVELNAGVGAERS